MAGTITWGAGDRLLHKQAPCLSHSPCRRNDGDADEDDEDGDDGDDVDDDEKYVQDNSDDNDENSHHHSLSTGLLHLAAWNWNVYDKVSDVVESWVRFGV